MLENASVGYTALDAYLRQDGETVTIPSRPTYDDPETGESHNITFMNSTFKLFEPQIRSPLRNYTPPDYEECSTSYSVLSPMLRDNLIKGYDDISRASCTYKIGDVTILDIVQDFTEELHAFKTTHQVLDVTIREHATELPVGYEGINYNNFKALDATTRNQLIISNTPLEALKTNPLVTDATSRNHLVGITEEVESFKTVNTVNDVIIRKDLHLAYNTENLNTINTVKDPVMIESLHVNYDIMNEVKTTVSVLDPDISGETIVPISCIGSTEQTQEITMNGNFTVYLNDQIEAEMVSTLDCNFNLNGNTFIGAANQTETSGMSRLEQLFKGTINSVQVVRDTADRSMLNVVEKIPESPEDTGEEGPPPIERGILRFWQKRTEVDPRNLALEFTQKRLT